MQDEQELCLNMPNTPRQTTQQHKTTQLYDKTRYMIYKNIYSKGTENIMVSTAKILFEWTDAVYNSDCNPI